MPAEVLLRAAVLASLALAPFFVLGALATPERLHMLQRPVVRLAGVDAKGPTVRAPREVRETLARPEARTADLGGSATTSEFDLDGNRYAVSAGAYGSPFTLGGTPVQSYIAPRRGCSSRSRRSASRSPIRRSAPPSADY